VDSVLQLFPEKFWRLGSLREGLSIRCYHDRTQALKARSYKVVQCRISCNTRPRPLDSLASVCLDVYHPRRKRSGLVFFYVCPKQRKREGEDSRRRDTRGQ